MLPWHAGVCGYACVAVLQFERLKRWCFLLYALGYSVERVVLLPAIILKPTLIQASRVLPVRLYSIVLGLLLVLSALQYVWLYQIVSVIMRETRKSGQGIDTKVHSYTDTHTCVAAEGLHTRPHRQRKEMARTEHQAKREE